MIKTVISALILLTLFRSISYADNNIYKNFEADYNFEFSGMIVARGILKGHLNNDNKTYSVCFKGKTTSFISIFYSLKEVIQGAVNIKNTKDIYYKSIEKRPKEKKEVYADFMDNTTAQIAFTKNGRRKNYTLRSMKGIFSPLSLYLFFMINHFKFGKIYYRNVAVTKHIYRVAIKPISYTIVNLDRLKRKKGRHHSIKVRLQLSKIDKDGTITADKKVKKIVAWISTEIPNIPILVESWHFIGLFRARLTALKLSPQ